MINKNILLVDDTETNIDILIGLLGDTYEVLVALDGQSALEIVNEERVDLILLDIMMPIMDGYEVCQRLKAEESTKNIPIIFITAKTDEDSIEKAYDIGGVDYVSKPFKPRELLARVKNQLDIQILIKDLEESKEELKLLAATDPMTKLYNRRYFSEVSQNILEISKRDKDDISVIMLDIDKFKNINDTYGHQVGDEVIIELSNKLKELQRKSDVVCRYGGEEFIILLPNTSIDGAKMVAQNIRVDIESIVVYLEQNKELRFTVSLGVSQIDIINETNIEASLKRADDAMYEAKQTGRNKVCIKSY